jgi:alpha-galactosidase
MAKWGVDLIKLDFCHHPGGFTPQQLYSNFSSWMDHSGRQMMFSTCEWGEGQPWLTFGDFANMIRVTHDHLPLFDYDGQGGKNGIGTKQVIEDFGAGNLGTYSKHGAFMDADLLETLFPTITYEESVTEFSLWALVSSPMIVATDVRKMSDEKKGILLNTEVIAVSQDPIAVGGKRIVNNTDGGQVWIKNLADGSVAIVLYNSNSKWGSRSVKITVEWAQIPGVQWSNSDLVLVRDLWAHEDVGKMSNGLTFEVDPKSVRMFRCTK